MEAHLESEPEVRGFKRLIKNFAPSWFAAVMGTGIFAVTSEYYSCLWPWLENLAVCLWVLNIIHFCLLLIPWTARWFLFKEDALRDIFWLWEQDTWEWSWQLVLLKSAGFWERFLPYYLPLSYQ